MSNLPQELNSIALVPVHSSTSVTHASLYGASHEVFEAEEGAEINDYERLEHYGDVILQFTSSTLIRGLFPRLTVGAASALRTRLVCNETFALLSDHFGLPQQLRAAQAQKRLLQSNPNIKADVFEAYICALTDERGLDVAQSFLRSVLTPMAKAAYEELRRVKTQEVVQISSPATNGTVPMDSSQLRRITMRMERQISFRKEN